MSKGHTKEKTSFKIRPAENNDIQPCAQVLMDEFVKQGEPWSIDRAREKLEEIFP